MLVNNNNCGTCSFTPPSPGHAKKPNAEHSRHGEETGHHYCTPTRQPLRYDTTPHLSAPTQSSARLKAHATYNRASSMPLPAMATSENTTPDLYLPKPHPAHAASPYKPAGMSLWNASFTTPLDTSCTMLAQAFRSHNFSALAKASKPWPASSKNPTPSGRHAPSSHRRCQSAQTVVNPPRCRDTHRSITTSARTPQATYSTTLQHNTTAHKLSVYMSREGLRKTKKTRIYINR
jgi:hypothetical protein